MIMIRKVMKCECGTYFSCSNECEYVNAKCDCLACYIGNREDILGCEDKHATMKDYILYKLTH